MREGRWETVTDSEFQHERRGLEEIREKLPDAEPWRAWSNFTFTAATGHVREVDLLVVAPGGVYLIELKDWHGSVESRNGSWLQTQPSGNQVAHGNPLHLANKKAKELAGLLRRETPPGQFAPWVTEAVCFTAPSLRLRLPPHDQHGVYTVRELVEMLGQPPRDARHRIDPTRSRQIKESLKRIGIARSDAAYKVGPYLLSRKSFDSGPTWADYLARHSELPETARIRVYLRERGADAELRSSVERAARREAAVLQRFRHLGVVQLRQYYPDGHPAGPALIFDYDPRTLRLDEYLAQYGEKLDILTRMSLVRQLAETVRSAHGARIYHRTLSAHAVHVVPRPGTRGPAGPEGDDPGWLNPHLQISDWQVSVQRPADRPRLGAAVGATRLGGTSLSTAGAHLSEAADTYLAPELTALRPDPVLLDVYGLGMLTYLLATGKPPGAGQAELSARLEAGEGLRPSEAINAEGKGLRPSAVVDGLSEYIDELVQAATAFRPEHRAASVDEFLEMLEVVEETLTAPALDDTAAEPPPAEPPPGARAAAHADAARPGAADTNAAHPGAAHPRPREGQAPEKDPLEAVAGDVLAGRWEVRRRLGTGSTSRAFLVRDLAADPSARRSKQFAVLKVALSEARGEVLEREAEVMGRLRPDSRIIRLVEPEPQRIGGRTVLVMEYVGDERDGDTPATAATATTTATATTATPAEPAPGNGNPTETRTRTGTGTGTGTEAPGATATGARTSTPTSTPPTGTPTATPTAKRHRRREETVARELREKGRLTVDQLEAYGDYLFGAVDFLEGEGVWHRDIKPDNIAIRVRPNRTRELVLIDFSLAGYPVQQWQAGTEGYLDPFIGTITRPVYDAHAERYALAVTLHEMASRELPVWGDGTVAPRQTAPEEHPYPTIAADAFEAPVRDGLVAFFRRALHRDASKRFPELKPMRDAWKKIFLDMDQAVPSSRRPSRTRHTAHPAAPASPDAATAAATNTATNTAAAAAAPPGAAPAAAAPGDTAPTPATTAARTRNAAAPPGAALPSAPLGEAEEETAERQRDRLAGQATRGTAIETSGLSPAAASFVYNLGVNTVGELLDLSQRRLINAPGLGPKTRREVLARIRQWRERFAEQPAAPLAPAGRREAREELSAAEAAVGDAGAATPGTAESISERALRSVSLDALAHIFVPEPRRNRANENEVEMVRLLLRLPDEHGALPDIGVWPMQKDVAAHLRLSPGRIPHMLKTQRSRWKRHPAVAALRREILEILRDKGRVASAAEIADTLAVRRGTRLYRREQRRALALAAVRAVVEVEQLDPMSGEFRHTPNRDAVDEGMGAGLLALEVGPHDAPDTPSAPALLHYAQRLGRVADDLAKAETLPTSATVLSELGAIPPPDGQITWDELRMVEVAAAASRTAAATARLEIYPRRLPLVRALRLTQAGLVRRFPGVPERFQPGLTVEEVHERVRSRFPEILDSTGGRALPSGGRLAKALREAGFDLVFTTRQDGVQRYLPRQNEQASSYLTSISGGRAVTLHATRYDDDPELAAAVRTGERLLASARRDGFRALTVRTGLAREAIRRLSAPDGPIRAEVVSVAALFLAALREQIDPRRKPTWETLLKADTAEPGTRAAMKFAEYATTAWGLVEPRIADRLTRDTGTSTGTHTGTGPILLVDAGVLARYDALPVLDRLAALSRNGGRPLWLLCPQNGSAHPPHLGRTAVPFQSGLGEWIELPEYWFTRTTAQNAAPPR